MPKGSNAFFGCFPLGNRARACTVELVLSKSKGTGRKESA